MNNQEVRVKQALALHQAGEIDAAKQLYESLIQEGVSSAAIWHDLGLIYAELSDWVSAKQAMRQGLQLNPADKTLHLHLANVLKQNQEFDEAKAILNNLLRISPENAAAYNNLGIVHYALKEWPPARQAFEAAIQLKADFVDAYYHLALTMLRQNDLNAAELTLQAILELDSSHPGAAFQLGSLYLLREQYLMALSPFQHLLKQHPYHFESHVNLAHAYLHLGQLSNAAMHYTQALEIQPNEEQALFNLGVISMQLGDLAAATRYYRRILQQAPRSFAAHNNLAVVLLAQKRREEALLHFKTALSIEPNNAALLHTLQLNTAPGVINETPGEYVRALFDGYADHYDAHLLQDLHYAVPAQFAALLTQHTPLNSASWNVLDLGCGTGLCAQWLQPLRQRGGQVVGVDISSNMIKEAEKKACYDALITADINAYLAKCERRFDLILAGDVLVYAGDLENLFKRVAAILQPQGWFIFNIELGNAKSYELAASGRFRHHPNYIHEILPAHCEIKVSTVVTLREQEHQTVQGKIFLVQDKRSPSR